jgi:hypothetical protein
LLVHGASGGVVGPPRAGVTTQLLHGEDGLLHLGTVQEPKFGLHHSKLVIGLEGLSCLGEERRVSGREVTVGDQSWSESIPCPIATMSGVGYELPQQLGLLIVGLKDRGDHLSKLGGGGGFPLPWAFSGPTHPLRVFTILLSKHVTISLKNKLSNMAYLNNGKGDNSTITEKQR